MWQGEGNPSENSCQALLNQQPSRVSAFHVVLRSGGQGGREGLPRCSNMPENGCPLLTMHIYIALHLPGGSMASRGLPILPFPHFTLHLVRLAS